MSINRTLAALVISVGALGTLPATAQEGTGRTIEQYTCKDIMRDSGTGRDIAIAFLHGYLLGKSGSSSFDLEEMTEQSDAFIDQCLDNPSEAAVNVLMTIQQ